MGNNEKTLNCNFKEIGGATLNLNVDNPFIAISCTGVTLINQSADITIELSADKIKGLKYIIINGITFKNQGEY